MSSDKVTLDKVTLDAYMEMMDTLADAIREIRIRTEAGESRGVVDDVLEHYGIQIEYGVDKGTS